MFTPLFNKLTLCFSTRSKQTQSQIMVFCRLRFNGEITALYRVGFYVTPQVWKDRITLAREGHPEAQTIALTLAHIQDQHERCLVALQLEAGTIPVTATAVKQRWQDENVPQKLSKAGLNKPDPEATLLDVYQDFLTHLDSRPKQERKADKTRGSYRMAGVHLAAFLKVKKDKSFLAEKVTPGFGMQLYDYLRERDMSADTANRYLNFIKAALQHALQYDKIGTNGLFQFKAPKGSPAKRIVFLSESTLAELETLPLKGVYDTARKWTLFLSYTGLDYKDARQIVANESAYRVRTEHGDKWVYQRLKLRHSPTWGECHIPILPQAERLLRELVKTKGKRGYPELKVINTHLKPISVQLQLPFKICTKICRKTAAFIYLKTGYTMPSIQKIMGHQSLAMTEKHYLSIQGFVVDRDMAKVKQSTVVDTQPFIHIHRAS
ncbi:hypothetical protein GO755_36095 [Spirosoma sp. HMF4905]|uniref:Core-binding (CB) domain-containing protein n=1 Tax=Spirosoma arboris TaxID=2682092 RepID=A0A7K1SNX1_9BACT|nr:phage integrase SAM-like domain-containing protein [Spirosoma arboris]MVM35500.1 hypothetical protein [Spirosoma arboris]